MTEAIPDLRPLAEGKLHAFFALTVCLLFTPFAQAVTTQSFLVAATITPGCSVTAGTGGVLGSLNFGTRSGVATGQVSTSFVPNGSLSIACTPGVSLSMSIDGGSITRQCVGCSVPAERTWWRIGFTAAVRWRPTVK